MAVVGELIAGGTFGLGLQILREAIKKEKDRTLTTKRILDRLDTTMSRIAPLLAQVDKLSKEEEGSKISEVIQLHLNQISSVGQEYSKLSCRHFRQKYRYKKQILESEASLQKIVDFEVQLDQWAKISEMITKFDEFTRPPTDGSPEENDECSSDGSKPKIDIHFRWKSRSGNKDYGFKFVFN